MFSNTNKYRMIPNHSNEKRRNKDRLINIIIKLTPVLFQSQNFCDEHYWTELFIVHVLVHYFTIKFVYNDLELLTDMQRSCCFIVCCCTFVSEEGNINFTVETN